MFNGRYFSRSYFVSWPFKIKKIKRIIFDDNQISIDGPTNLTCSDNQKKRFEASNWDVFEVDGHNFDSIENGLKPIIKIAETDSYNL